jgi:hypothetical protein
MSASAAAIRQMRGGRGFDCFDAPVATSREDHRSKGVKARFFCWDLSLS